MDLTSLGGDILKVAQEQWAIILAGFGAALAGAIVTNAFRAAGQLGIGVLDYLAHSLPGSAGIDIAAESIVVDIVLTDATGGEARYSKELRAKVVARQLQSYTEGVTSAGTASDFRSEKGLIVRTRVEHGYWLADIDFGTPLRKGDELNNVFAARLTNAFQGEEENWAQEIVYPTKRFTIRVHFPLDRPPKLVSCGQIKGVKSSRLTHKPEVATRAGLPVAELTIERPKLGKVYQLSWRW